MIDQGPYSRNAVTGEDAYFLFTLNNWKEKADKVQFRGSVAYDENKIKDGYEIVCEGSNDGNTWTELAALRVKVCRVRPASIRPIQTQIKIAGIRVRCPPVC